MNAYTGRRFYRLAGISRESLDQKIQEMNEIGNDVEFERTSSGDEKRFNVEGDEYSIHADAASVLGLLDMKGLRIGHCGG